MSSCLHGLARRTASGNGFSSWTEAGDRCKRNALLGTTAFAVPAVSELDRLHFSQTRVLTGFVSSGSRSLGFRHILTDKGPTVGFFLAENSGEDPFFRSHSQIFWSSWQFLISRILHSSTPLCCRSTYCSSAPWLSLSPFCAAFAQSVSCLPPFLVLSLGLQSCCRGGGRAD